MTAEIPYTLYLKFFKPAESVSLIISLESLGLICLGEEKIDDEFSIVHYHFKSDEAKTVVLHVEIENNCSERINISMYNGADHTIIKELFSFLENFDADKTALIDQQVKNTLYLKDMNSFESTAEGTVIPEAWISSTERAATLPVSFDDFYNNTAEIAKRDFLLNKPLKQQ